MEKWQKDYITENLLILMQDIDCNDILLDYLVTFGALHKVELEEMESKKGKTKKAKFLLEVLCTRTGGYENLTKALYHCQQTGAVIILLYGVQVNLTDQSPFKFCGIDVKMDEILSKEVLFEGMKLQLKDVCKSIDSVSLHKIVEDNMDASLYKQFCCSPEQPVTLAIDSIPTNLPYYIPRTLSITTQLEPAIFESFEDDVFCIEGIELYQVSRLIHARQNIIPQEKNKVDLSRDQTRLDQLSANIIVLEHHEHFANISAKTKHLTHWIRYDQGKYFYVKSTNGNGIERINRFLVSNNHDTVSDDDFVEQCLASPKNSAILLYDSPGMGKSVLLAQLARYVKTKQPTHSIIYFEISALINKIRRHRNITSGVLKECFLEIIASNKLGRDITKTLLDNDQHQVELFLDAFDEVHEDDQEYAHKILDCISKECKNIRMFITTRPHRRNELESKLGVLGYNILPFNDLNKTSFFLQYWQNEYDVVPTKEINQFAIHCLNTLASNMSSDEGDIAGIPLQCRMLAEIYAEDARLGGLISIESHIELNSIYQLYQYYVGLKFSNFSSDSEKQLYYDFHVNEAISILFSKKYRKNTNNISRVNLETIYRIGIFEPSKSDNRSPIFVHRTFAEYLAAEYLISSISVKLPINFSAIQFFDLLIGHALRTAGSRKLMNIKDQYFHAEINPTLYMFEHVVIARFMNFFLSDIKANQDFSSLKTALKGSKYFNLDNFVTILNASIAANVPYVFKIVVGIYLDINTASNSLENHLQQNDRISIPFADWSQIQYFLDFPIIAVMFTSLDFVKLVFDFVRNITGVKSKKLNYTTARHSMFISLKRGHFQIFEYLFNFAKPRFLKEPLLHYCLYDSHGEPDEVIFQKGQILKMLLQENPDLKYQGDSILEQKVHFILLKILIEDGVDPSIANSGSDNIAHLTANYFSPDEYHQFVTFIVSRNLQMIFKHRGDGKLTPIHVALSNIELKTETLELLVGQCRVNFNDNFPTGGSEFECAINAERSLRVLKDIARLGGDSKYFTSHLLSRLMYQVSNGIKIGKVDALEKLIACGISVNKNPSFFKTHLGKALRWENEAAVSFLVENGCDVNAQFLYNECRKGCTFRCFPWKFSSPLQYSLNHNLTKSVSVLEEAGAKHDILKSLCASTSLCCLCYPFYSCWLATCIPCIIYDTYLKDDSS